MRVLICGSRGWQDKQAIRDLLHRLDFDHGTCTIIHGDARGADRIAAAAAPNYGHRVEPHPAAWQLHGKRAGYLRNAEMLASGIDHVYAFRSAGVSRGTDQMVALATEAGVPVTVVQRDELQPRGALRAAADANREGTNA